MLLILKQVICYASFLVFPVLFLAGYMWAKSKKRIWLVLWILSFVFLWMRFIEPNNIKGTETTIDVWFDADIALISDLHLGVYKKSHYLSELVKIINKQDVDMVMIAGDFTYEPQNDDLSKLFAPLADIKYPVYAVLGNHDVEKPGPPIREELEQILEKYNVNLLNNDIVSLNGFTLVWLGSKWNDEDDVSLLEELSLWDNIIVLMHNPDTTLKYVNNNADITLAGHTHGGQIRIPWLYKHVIPTTGDFDRGLTEEEFGKLFVTAGVGETALPMRLFNPPVVEVLRLR